MKILACIALLGYIASASSSEHLDEYSYSTFSPHSSINGLHGCMLKIYSKACKYMEQISLSAGPKDKLEIPSKYKDKITFFDQGLLQYKDRESFTPLILGLLNKEKFMYRVEKLDRATNYLDVFFKMINSIPSLKDPHKQAVKIVLKLFNDNEEIFLKVDKGVLQDLLCYSYFDSLDFTLNRMFETVFDVTKDLNSILSAGVSLPEKDLDILKVALGMTKSVFDAIETISNGDCNHIKRFFEDAKKALNDAEILPLALTEIIVGYSKHSQHFDFLNIFQPEALSVEAIKDLLLNPSDKHILECEKFQFQYFIVAATIVAYMISNKSKYDEKDYDIIIKRVKEIIDSLSFLNGIKTYAADKNPHPLLFLYSLSSLKNLEEEIKDNPLASFFFRSTSVRGKSTRLFLKLSPEKQHEHDEHFEEFEKIFNIQPDKDIAGNTFSPQELASLLKFARSFYPEYQPTLFLLNLIKACNNPLMEIQELPLIFVMLLNIKGDKDWGEYDHVRISKKVFDRANFYLTFKSQYETKNTPLEQNKSRKYYAELLKEFIERFKDKVIQ